MPQIDSKLLKQLLSNPQLNPQLLESILGNSKLSEPLLKNLDGQGLAEGVESISLGSAVSGGLGKFGGIAGQAVKMIDGMDGESSMGGDVASKALEFGAMGAQVAGPWGAAIGAVGGGIYGSVMHKKEEEAQKKAKIKAEKKFDAQALNASKQYSKSVLSTFPTKGVESSGYYAALGGKIPASNIQYQAEGGEVIEHNPFRLPGTDSHGEVNQLASDISKIEGDKHSAPSGGVGMEGGERIFSDQLYVEDSLYQSLKNI
jgi:hypothetical protein